MAHAPLSHRLMLSIPVLVAVLLLVLCLAPMRLGAVPLTPSVVWLMTLSIGALYPAAWPVTWVFFLGLLSDFLLGSPLGAQALISIALVLFTQANARRASHQLFYLRWLEAAGLLLASHLALWVISGWIVYPRPPLQTAAIAAGISAAWYPLFYGGALLLLKLLPARA